MFGAARNDRQGTVCFGPCGRKCILNIYVVQTSADTFNYFAPMHQSGAINFAYRGSILATSLEVPTQGITRGAAIIPRLIINAFGKSELFGHMELFGVYETSY